MIGGELVFLNATPPWLAGVALLASFALVLSWLSSRGRTPGVRGLLLAVRLLALIAIAAAVLRPALEEDLTRAKRQHLAIAVDDSLSMTLGGGALASSVTRWLEDNGGDIDDLATVFKPEVWKTAPIAEPLDLSGDQGVAFERNDSPLGRSLESLGELRPDLAAVVLLSDGRDTDHPGEVPELPYRVFPVVFDTGGSVDLWIEQVRIPPVAFIRTPVEVRVAIGSTGIDGGMVELTLFEQGSPITSQQVDLAQVGTGNAEVALFFTPRRTGRRAYRLEITPMAGEVSVENNKRQFSLNVIRDKTRVLMLTGSPSPDSKFLRRRLRQDPGIDLITFMILRTPSDLNLVDSEELSLIPFPTDELFNKELPSFDAVIFANFDYAAYVPRRYLKNVADFVREAGGGVAMLGGDRSFGLGGYVGSPLAEVLPVDLRGGVSGSEFRSGPFRPRLTPTGLSHPVLRWKQDSEDNRKLWESLPELDGLNWAWRARAGGVVAVEAPQVKTEYGAAPVIAFGEYGAGRTMAVMTDSLWRWKIVNESRGGDSSVYRDFWTRALRWLVHDPDMELVRLSPPVSGLRAGTRVRFAARVLDHYYKPAEEAEVSGKLVDEEGNVFELTWKRQAPGDYVSDPVEIGNEGLWRISAQAIEGSEYLGRDEIGFPVEPRSPEYQRVGADFKYLEKLADSSGGRVIDAGSSEELFKLLESQGRAATEVVGRRINEPWATTWVLLLAVALLGLDWALRRFLL